MHSRRTNHVAAALLAAVLLLAPGGRADTVWTIASGPNAKPFPRKNMRVEGLTPDGLMFRSATADRAAEPRPLGEIWRIEVDDEPALNAGETALVASKWDDAVAAYQKAITSSRKDWVKRYATVRLITAAEKSGKFSTAASAYATLVVQDLRQAMKAKPDVPADAKAELPGAINAVKSALATPKLQAGQRNALQAFLAELYIANGQLKEAQALSGKPGAAPAATATPGVPPARGDAPAPAPTAPGASAADRAQADLKLQLAVASIKQKKYQDALDTIESVAASLSEPDQQAAALFTLAEAKAGLAGDDPAKLKDAALAYMRVVAHFKNRPDAPHVADALMRTGAVLEQAKLLPDALEAYEAVQADYEASPHAKDAAAAAARVKKAIEESRG